jgi:hypothetical protein
MAVISKTTVAQGQSTWTVQDWTKTKIVTTSTRRTGASQPGPAPGAGPRASTPAQTTGKVVAPAADAADPKQVTREYDYYKTIIQNNGGEFNSDPGKPNLLFFRTPTPLGANGGRGAYDDTAVLLWKDASGAPHVRTYHANTEPNEITTDRYGSDVRGGAHGGLDGRPDPARMPVGQYLYHFTGPNSGPEVQKENAGIGTTSGGWHNFFGDAVERDVNRDGIYSPEERTRSRNGMPNIEIHAGFDGAAFWTPYFYQGGSGTPPTMRGGNGTASAGCVSLPNGEFKQMISDLGLVKGQGVDVKVTLVDQGGPNVPISRPSTALNVPPQPREPTRTDDEKEQHSRRAALAPFKLASNT